MSAPKEAANKVSYSSEFGMLWQFADLDRPSSTKLWLLLRLCQVLCLTSTMVHPDEYWQATEPAYKSVYSDVQDVRLPWEWSAQF